MNLYSAFNSLLPNNEFHCYSLELDPTSARSLFVCLTFFVAALLCRRLFFFQLVQGLQLLGAQISFNGQQPTDFLGLVSLFSGDSLSSALPLLSSAKGSGFCGHVLVNYHIEIVLLDLLNFDLLRSCDAEFGL